MKKSITSLLSRMSNESSNSSKETKQSNAQIIFSSNCRTFTAAELWNIQKLGKSRPQRRFL